MSIFNAKKQGSIIREAILQNNTQQSHRDKSIVEGTEIHISVQTVASTRQDMLNFVLKC